MLVNLHVKNLALIEEENIDFDEGLNILSGETGAGKSIILGSIKITYSPSNLRKKNVYRTKKLRHGELNPDCKDENLVS